MLIWKMPGGNRGSAARRRLALAGVLLAAGPFLAAGQMALELRLPSSNLLLFESVVGTVTFRNNTGRLVVFGDRPGGAQFRFGIELGHGKLIKPVSAAPLVTSLALAPGETRSLEFNITRLYAINAIGRYSIQAQVAMGGVTYVSAPVHLDVIKGSELSRIKAGVPDDPRASRTYVLEYIQKNTSEEHIYLRIEDEQAGEIYGVFNLGRVVRVRAPDLQVDEAGNVHVLFQTPGMSFIHAVFTPYGTCLATDSYTGGVRNVEIKRLPNGRITVNRFKGKEPSKSGAAGTPPPGRAEGPVTEIKRKIGGLFGRSDE